MILIKRILIKKKVCIQMFIEVVRLSNGEKTLETVNPVPSEGQG